jgi:hypothetical protein
LFTYKRVSLREIVTVDMLNDKFEQMQNKIQYRYYQDQADNQLAAEDKNFNEFIFKNFVCEYLMFKDDVCVCYYFFKNF